MDIQQRMKEIAEEMVVLNEQASVLVKESAELLVMAKQGIKDTELIPDNVTLGPWKGKR